MFALVVGLTLWTLRAHIGEAIMWLAELAENAGPWGVVATILALAVWVLVPFMPINLFEVVIGYIFPLWTAPAARSQGPCLQSGARTAPEAHPLRAAPSVGPR